MYHLSSSVSGKKVCVLFLSNGPFYVITFKAGDCFPSLNKQHKSNQDMNT